MQLPSALTCILHLRLDPGAFKQGLNALRCCCDLREQEAVCEASEPVDRASLSITIARFPNPGSDGATWKRSRRRAPNPRVARKNPPSSARHLFWLHASMLVCALAQHNLVEEGICDMSAPIRVIVTLYSSSYAHRWL